MFAEIVWSRFVIAEKQRVAGGSAAGGDDHRADRRSDRAAEPALFSRPARRQNKDRNGDRRALALVLLISTASSPSTTFMGIPPETEILRQVADRLAKAMEGRGSAARIGGDEFAVLCKGIGARDEAIALGQEIKAIFATRFDVFPPRRSLDLRLWLCPFSRLPPPSQMNWCVWPTPRSTAPRPAGPGPGRVRSESRTHGRGRASGTSFLSRAGDRKAQSDLGQLSTTRPERRLRIAFMLRPHGHSQVRRFGSSRLKLPGDEGDDLRHNSRARLIHRRRDICRVG